MKIAVYLHGAALCAICLDNPEAEANFNAWVENHNDGSCPAPLEVHRMEVPFTAPTREHLQDQRSMVTKAAGVLSLFGLDALMVEQAINAQFMPSLGMGDNVFDMSAFTSKYHH